MTDIFVTSLSQATDKALALRKKLFVHLAEHALPTPTDVSEAITQAKLNYVFLRLSNGTPDYKRFSRAVSVEAPAFAVIGRGSVTIKDGATDLVDFLQDNEHTAAPTLQDLSAFRKPRGSRLLSIRKAQETEALRLRDLISADRREVNARNSIYSPPRQQGEQKLSNSGDCVLSVRLLEGETVKATFQSDQTLKDVKRWLQDEHNLVLVPEDNPSTSRFTKIGFPEPSRYAFFFPATRATFSEAQELSRLSDLGLLARVALILKPDYDEAAMAAAQARTTWKDVRTKATTLLLALYSFFDYGVDEAGRDLHDFGQEMLTEHVPHPVLVTTSAIVEEEERRPEQVEMDYSLVGLATRLRTPAPGGLMHISQDEMVVEREDKING